MSENLPTPAVPPVPPVPPLPPEYGSQQPDQPEQATEATQAQYPGSAKPGYPQPAYPQPGYPQAGYPQPAYPQPAYPQPGYPQTGYPQQGYPAPAYATPVYPAAAPKKSRTLGLVALIGAAAGIIVATVLATVAGSNLAPAFALMIENRPTGGDPDLSYLSPVRGWVLAGELSFWLGTAVGIWAIVQGWIAAAKRRGRAWGVAAIIVGACGPLIYFVPAGLTFLFTLGAALPE